MRLRHRGTAGTVVMVLSAWLSSPPFTHADGEAGAAPLKVFLLAGQSNMQGMGRISTFAHMKMDPVTVPLLEKMVDGDGEPRVIDGVWISTEGCARDGEKFGPLTAGFGGDRGGAKIGPELTFGIYLHELLKEPILIIKTAWGGKSLAVDFRPPSAGPYTFGPGVEPNAKLLEERRKAAGHYYRLMMDHVKHVLSDIKRVYPDYEPRQGCEVAGFVWFQGCNDFGDQTTYPHPGEPGGYDEYSRLLACLIRDVRKELHAPDMKTVIDVLGINGSLDDGDRVRQIEPEHIPWLREFRKAMAAPAAMPEFKGSVAAVYTEKFWEPRLEELQSRWKLLKAKNRELGKDKDLTGEQRKAAFEAFRKTVYTDEEWKLMSVGVSNAAYHYLGSAKIMARIGKASAEAMAGLLLPGSAAAGADAQPGETIMCDDSAPEEQAPFPGTKSLFGDKFDLYRDGGRIVVVPKKVAAGKPWVWRARFWGHEPQFDLAMLEKGYHVVYCNVAGLLGNPEAVKRWDAFYTWLTGEHGFAKKVVLEGMSRGGLIIYNWAAANPDKVAAIYGDAPVMDLKSWPGFESRMVHRAYDFPDEAAFRAYKGNPVDNLAPLAKAGIPIIHVVGDKDTTVPVAKNTAIAEKRYKAMGGVMKVIHKPDTGHHPHSLKDPTPIVDFIVQRAKR